MFLTSAFREFLFASSTKYRTPTQVSGLTCKRDDISILKKSLSLRVVDAGDDEGTMAELYALESPEYSTERAGIHIVASPKHADGLVIVGAITDNMKKAVLDAYEVIPEPKIVIACGDRAIHGDTRFYGAQTGARDILRIDIEIPGNPPRAIEIFSHLQTFIDRIQ